MEESVSIMDVDSLVNKFLREKQSGIVTLHNIFFKNRSDQLSYRALVEEVFDELKTGTVTFLNKNKTVEDLDAYLFYIVNAFCKKKAVPIVKKSVEYLCPGCLFLGKQNLIPYQGSFSCDSCAYEAKISQDPKLELLYSTFKKHNKAGWRCFNCERFIPQPLDASTKIVCPYLDCFFVGDTSSLKKMNHPSSGVRPEKLSIDFKPINGQSLKDTLVSNEESPLAILENKEALKNKIQVISDIIENQSNTTHWNSANFTIKHKVFVYQAFKKMLEKYPNEMVSYLLENSRSGGFQNKIFQEYISILENSLPLPVKKGKTIYKIDSLLDERLSLFDGISVFNAEVNDKKCIKNNTQEFYIGGRKGSYAEPYYIGKLLNITRNDTNESILHCVKEYSFSKIKINDIPPGTPVTVTHLRVPPHYQMGGMVYVNRIRKKIVDKSLMVLNKENDAKKE